MLKKKKKESSFIHLHICCSHFDWVSHHFCIMGLMEEHYQIFAPVSYDVGKKKVYNLVCSVFMHSNFWQDMPFENTDL